MQAGTVLQVLRCLLVPGYVTLELTVIKASLLLLQLAPLVLRATEQVQLVQELLVVLYAEEERTAQPPTLSHVLFAMQAGMAQVVAMRLLVPGIVTLTLTRFQRLVLVLPLA